MGVAEADNNNDSLVVEPCESKTRPSTKVDYVYKRCYIDKQGNFINPRTPWDELLKYYHSPSERLMVSEGQRRLSRPAFVRARRKVKLDKAQRARLAQVYAMEAQYLETTVRERKTRARRRVYEREAQYLE